MLTCSSQSLERMALSLARDKLNYSAEQMSALSVQIRQGDLTPVMQIYEDDIRSPLKSVVGGTLLRTLLVQVQKAKVDIDQALAGIDKLLKSQELTFAFVGVAPAFSVVYVSVGYARGLWAGSRGKGRYGGVKRRWQVWSIIRYAFIEAPRMFVSLLTRMSKGESSGFLSVAQAPSTRVRLDYFSYPRLTSVHMPQSISRQTHASGRASWTMSGTSRVQHSVARRSCASWTGCGTHGGKSWDGGTLRTHGS